MYQKAYIALLTLVLLAGCASQKDVENAWPESLPPLVHYQAIYDGDPDNQKIQSRDEYLTWVIRFYDGWVLYAQGWHRMTDQVLAGISDEAERNRVQDHLARLGKRISGEWAKDSQSRVIFTPTVAPWGNALLESINRNEVNELVDRVNADVEDLFAGELESSAISMERYYTQDAGEFF